MPVSVMEKFESRQSSLGDNASVELAYIVSGTDDDIAAKSSLLDASPVWYDGLVRQGVTSAGSVTAGNISGTFEVTATSGTVHGTAQLVIGTENHAPDLTTLSNLSVIAFENTPLGFNALAGATDADGPSNAFVPYYVAIAQAPSHGKVAIDATGYALYTPDAFYSGTDSFQVGAYDSDWTGGIATYSITVTAKAALPVGSSYHAAPELRMQAGASVTLDLSRYVGNPDGSSNVTYSVDDSYPGLTASLSGSVATWTITDINDFHDYFSMNGEPVPLEGFSLHFSMTDSTAGGWEPRSYNTVATLSYPASGTQTSPTSFSLNANDYQNLILNGTSLTIGLNSSSNSVAFTITGDIDGTKTITISSNDDADVYIYDIGNPTGLLNCVWTSSTASDRLYLISEGTIGDVTFDGILGFQAGAISGDVHAGSLTDGLVVTDVSGSILTVGALHDLDVWGDLNVLTSEEGAIENVSVGGDVTGDITAYDAISLNIGGSLSGDVESQMGRIDLVVGLNMDSHLIAATGIAATVGHTATLIPGTGAGTYVIGGTITGTVSTIAGDISLDALQDMRASVTDELGDIIRIVAGRHIAGAITAGAGNIITIIALGGDIGRDGSNQKPITATLGNIGTISAGGDIVGDIVASNGTIYKVQAGGTISGDVTSGGDIGGIEIIYGNPFGVSAGTDISGLVTSTAGTVYLVHANRDITGGTDAIVLSRITAGRDISGAAIEAFALGSVTAGRDLSADVSVGYDIGTVAAGRAILGDITATGGAIGSITAGGSAWAHTGTAAGSIGSATISVNIWACDSIGPITVLAAVGYDGAISNTTITSDTGDIGTISAATGINANINAHGNIGNVITTRGDIAGSLTATYGSIGNIASITGSITASLATGWSIGNLTALHNFTGVITAGNAITASTPLSTIATIGNITALLGNISSSITVGNSTVSQIGSVGKITAGSNLSGNIIVAGSIGAIYVGYLGGTISGELIANTGSIGTIWAGGDITNLITSCAGSLTIVSGGDIKGEVKANDSIFTMAVGTISGNISSTIGQISAFSGGDISSTLTSLGDIVTWAIGKITATVTSNSGGIIEVAKGNIQSRAIAASEINAISNGGAITQSTFNSLAGAKGWAVAGIENVTVEIPKNENVYDPDELFASLLLNAKSSDPIGFNSYGSFTTSYVGAEYRPVQLNTINEDLLLARMEGILTSSSPTDAFLGSLASEFIDYSEEFWIGVKAIPSAEAWSTLHNMQIESTTNRLAKVMVQNDTDSDAGSYFRGSIVFANDVTGGTNLGEWAFDVDLVDARFLTPLESKQRLLNGSAQVVLVTVGASESLSSLGKGYTGLGFKELKTWATTYNGTGFKYTGTGIDKGIGLGFGTSAPKTVIPRGFASAEQFGQASSELSQALVKSGINDFKMGVRGSAITGKNSQTGKPFGPNSDIDFFVESRILTRGLKTSQNIPGFVHPNRIYQKFPALEAWAEKWSKILAREISIGGFVPGSVP